MPIAVPSRSKGCHEHGTEAETSPAVRLILLFRFCGKIVDMDSLPIDIAWPAIRSRVMGNFALQGSITRVGVEPKDVPST